MTLDEAINDPRERHEIQVWLSELRRARIEIELLEMIRDQYKAENAQLRQLLTDYYNAPCMICNPWAENHQCKYDEGEDCLLATRALELGIEASE